MEVGMTSRIAVLSGQSLFVEGIISRLREHAERLEVHHIEPKPDDYIDRIKRINPTAVVIDATDENKDQCCYLCELLLAFPWMMIVRLAANQRDVQLIRSSTQRFEDVQDLIDSFLPPQTSRA
jgi:DNA-binding NarL/FixJ family response regulator